MNGSTFCEIKYMKGYFVYDSDWGWSENTGSHTHTKITHKLLPHAHTPPPKEINTFLKMFPKSKGFNYQKNQWLFI